MEQKLVAPASAKWNWGEFVRFTGTPKGYGFQASVDSQNRFGAMLRTRFNCIELEGTQRVVVQPQ